MKLLSHNAPSLTRSLSKPVIGTAVSALLHALLWVLWPKDHPSEPETKLAQVIEVALVDARTPEPPAPEVKPPTPPPPPPKTEKPPEKAAPKKMEKPRPKPAPRKEPKPEPTEESPPSTPSAPAAAEPVQPQTAPAPQPYVAASYKDASLKNPPTRYPALALERRWEGKVILNVQVLPDGSAGEVRVASSSGHEILDEATVEQVRSWRFIPAHRGDQAVSSWVTLPIEYKLKH